MSTSHSFAIIGGGAVSTSLAAGLLKHNHVVTIGVRDPSKLKDFQSAHTNEKLKIMKIEDAVQHGEIIIFAVNWQGAKETCHHIHKYVAKKIVIDVTNPIRVQSEQKYIGHLEQIPNSSGGEEVQKWLPESYVVKAWNSIGNAFMIDPTFDHPTMPICGNNEDAKKVVGQLVKSVGWEPLDLGGIIACQFIEPLCPLWCTTGMKTGNWSNAFKILTLPKN